jgi:hypothetical protein
MCTGTGTGRACPTPRTGVTFVCGCKCTLYVRTGLSSCNRQFQSEIDLSVHNFSSTVARLQSNANHYTPWLPTVTSPPTMTNVSKSTTSLPNTHPSLIRPAAGKHTKGEYRLPGSSQGASKKSSRVHRHLGCIQRFAVIY